MNNWGATDAYKLADNGDGTYSITVSLSAGTYQYKVADSNWSWSCPAGDNATLKLDADCEVTFTLDVAANEVYVEGDGIGEVDPMVIESITAVGAGKNGFLNDENWNEKSTANVMTEADGVYSITYTNVGAGEYEFKFAANGAWAYSWGTGVAAESGVECDASFNGGNGIVAVEKDGSTVTLTLDMSNMDPVTGAGAKCIVTVEAPADVDDGSKDIKYQLKGNSLRLVTWVDSLDYKEIVFNVTIDGQTAAIPCTTVYASINANDMKLDNAAEVFNENALYFVTYTINNIPESVDEFDVSVTWTDLEGNTHTSATRTITL
jgi:hypothetical protein